MKRTDIAGLLALLQSEYPQSFSKLTKTQMNAKAQLWDEMLTDYDGAAVMAAVKTLLSEGREFAPSIGQIQTRYRELTAPAGLTEAEAWALVSKACANGSYGYKEEYAKLPPEVQTAVGSAEQLREWAKMDEETVQSVVASNFMRSYKVTKKRSEFTAALPENVRMLLATAGRKQIAEGEING